MSFFDLVVKYKEKFPNANEDFVRKKTHGFLRCCFHCELKKMKEKKFENGANDVLNLLYFDIFSHCYYF